MRKSRAMNMRALITALLLVSSAVSVKAQRNTLKPSDFEPLTSLPWKKPEATLEGVLDTIFREPNPAIRYPVLAEYLRTIPVGRLGRAFDLCIALEGTQTPDDLVEFFLPIWAKRDPKACWKRTKELFHVVGIEEGWLNYDSWKRRERITVQDIEAIRASRFWIENRLCLVRFGTGVEQSSLSRRERVGLMKEFAEEWFARFDSWPGYFRGNFRTNYPDSWRDFAYPFELPLERLRKFSPGDAHGDGGYFEIVMRRWMEAEPKSGAEIIEYVRQTDWSAVAGKTERHAGTPSIELLILWAKGDFLGIVRWADSLDIKKDEIATVARGLLMSRVEPVTREKWLAEARVGGDVGNTVHLLDEWGKWDPKSALDAAVATNDSETITDVASTVVDGPWHLTIPNACHYGLEIIKDFDVAKLPEEIRRGIRTHWSQFVMEEWGSIDVAKAAPYGFYFMLATDYAPRDRLMRFFSGHDEYPDEGGMIDRTFCALRVWAVVKPKEMKAWIGTIKEADMRKALTWLLDHPWVIISIGNDIQLLFNFFNIHS